MGMRDARDADYAGMPALRGRRVYIHPTYSSMIEAQLPIAGHRHKLSGVAFRTGEVPSAGIPEGLRGRALRTNRAMSAASPRKHPPPPRALAPRSAPPTPAALIDSLVAEGESLPGGELYLAFVRRKQAALRSDADGADDGADTAP